MSLTREVFRCGWLYNDLLLEKEVLPLFSPCRHSKYFNLKYLPFYHLAFLQCQSFNFYTICPGVQVEIPEFRTTPTDFIVWPYMETRHSSGLPCVSLIKDSAHKDGRKKWIRLTIFLISQAGDIGITLYWYLIELINYFWSTVFRPVGKSIIGSGWRAHIRIIVFTDLSNCSCRRITEAYTDRIRR